MSNRTRSSTDLYLELLKRVLVRWGEDEWVPLTENGSPLKDAVKRAANRALASRGFAILKTEKFAPEKRENGRDWPARAMTMIGMKRLDNLQHCIESVIHDEVVGDLIETGVWRGGAGIFMRAVLAANGDSERLVWCADSFRGHPEPDVEKYPQDAGNSWHLRPIMAVPLEEVKENFKKFNLLDDRVKFLPGWFRDTLPSAPIDQISVLRLDGVMYESTMDALNALYHKVSPGGFIIADDYGIPEDVCRRAIHDFREAHGVTEPIIDIDGWAVYWRRKK